MLAVALLSHPPAARVGAAQAARGAELVGHLADPHHPPGGDARLFLEQQQHGGGDWGGCGGDCCCTQLQLCDEPKMARGAGEEGAGVCMQGCKG